MNEILQQLMRHFDCKNQSELAEKLKVHPMVISQWKARKNIPGKWAIHIEELTDGKFQASEITRQWALAS